MTCTCGGASSGNCAIGSVGMAMAPARTITSEQTLARIGRLIKVSTIMVVSPGPKGPGLHLDADSAYTCRAGPFGPAGYVAGGWPSGAGATGAPSTSFCAPEMTTFSPGLIPWSTG